MPGPTFQTTLGVIVMVGWVLFGVAVAIRPRGPRESVDKRDWRSHLAVMVQGVGFAFAWGWRRDPTDDTLQDAVGEWPLMIATALLAWSSGLFAVAAMRALGKQWSIRARILDTHHLITTGPYAAVRHPIYSSMFGLMLATALTFSTPFGIAAAAVVYLAGTLWRVRVEERLLHQAFGQAHTRYVERVPALIPRWRRH